MTRNEMRAAVKEIAAMIKDIEKGQSVDVQIDTNSRKLTSWLRTITSSDGHYMCYSCKTIPGGVRITCDAKFKITGFRVVQKTTEGSGS